MRARWDEQTVSAADLLKLVRERGPLCTEDELDVIGAGVDEGRIWLAMELVRGAPITTWADRAGLDRRQRTALLASCCDAVHHAHLRGAPSPPVQWPR